MSKRGALFMSTIILLGLLLAINISAQDTQTPTEVYADLGEVALKQETGLTSDNAFYLMDELMEKLILLGKNPEKALAYKEEKIVEAKQMIKERNIEGAKKALEKADLYGEILKKEVSPEIEKRARESSKAVKELLKSLEENLKGEEWEEVNDIITAHLKQEGEAPQSKLWGI